MPSTNGGSYMDAGVTEATQNERRTHGSDQRPPRDLAVALRSFAAADIAEQLRMEPAFMTDGRNAQTVHDDGTVRALVSVVAAGREIGADRSDGYVTLSLTEGGGMLRRADDDLELAAGTTVIMAPGAPWRFEATESSVVMAHFWAFDADRTAWIGDAAMPDEGGLAPR
jgi:quercetin dioxygenase-like cupin family protein